MRKATLPVSILLAAALVGRATAESTPETRIVEPTTWFGTVSVSSPVTVAPGTELTLAAGSRLVFSPGGTLQVEGSLVAAGTAEQPVRLKGTRGSGSTLVTLTGDTARLTLTHVELFDAHTGIALRGGAVTATQLLLSGNGTGLILEVKSHAQLTDTTFTDNDLGLGVQNNSSCVARNLTLTENRVGLAISNGSRLVLEESSFAGNGVGYGQHNACDAKLLRCTFQGNQTGVGLRQTRRSPTISFTTFRDNQIGVAAQLFSHVVVEASTLVDNRKGFSAVNFCGSYLRYNAFRGNDQAILLDHKSNARIENNHIKGNRVGLFADYSSYPKVRDNLFAENQWHVRLGIYQSAEWEQDQGSRGLMMEAARGAESRNPMMLSGSAPEGPRVFSVAENAWDPATVGELAAGDDTNVSRFWDGRDQEPVRYEGFGEGEYAVDVIRFSPPVAAPGLPVGPGAWKPLDQATVPPGNGGITPRGKPLPPAPGAAPPGRP